MPRVSEEYLKDVKLKILHSALKCFGSKGIAGTSMRDICKESGLSTGALYHHFKSKDEVIASIASLGRDLNDELFHLHLSPEEKITELLNRVFDAYKTAFYRNASAANIHFYSESLINDEVMKLIRASYEQVRFEIIKILKELKRKKKYKKEFSPEDLADVIVSMQMGFQYQLFIMPELRIDQFKNTVRTMIFSMIRD